MEIHASARKHRIADEDIEHATTHPITIYEEDDDTRLYLGPSRSADLLEIVTSSATTAPSWQSTP